jgi:hypothetical protein
LEAQASVERRHLEVVQYGAGAVGETEFGGALGGLFWGFSGETNGGGSVCSPAQPSPACTVRCGAWVAVEEPGTSTERSTLMRVLQMDNLEDEFQPESKRRVVLLMFSGSGDDQAWW